jgi:hypothetical protein
MHKEEKKKKTLCQCIILLASINIWGQLYMQKVEENEERLIRESPSA